MGNDKFSSDHRKFFIVFAKLSVKFVILLVIEQGDPLSVVLSQELVRDVGEVLHVDADCTNLSELSIVKLNAMVPRYQPNNVRFVGQDLGWQGHNDKAVIACGWDCAHLIVVEIDVVDAGLLPEAGSDLILRVELDVIYFNLNGLTLTHLKIIIARHNNQDF